MSRILEEYADIYKDFIDESQKLYKTLGLGNNTKQIIENIYAQNHEKMVKGLSEIFHANSMENEAKDCRNFIDSKIANSMFWSKSVITSDNLAANRMEMKNFLEEIEDVEYEIKGAIYDMDSLDNNKELVTSLQELIHAFIKSIDVAEKMMIENLSKSEMKEDDLVREKVKSEKVPSENRKQDSAREKKSLDKKLSNELARLAREMTNEDEANVILGFKKVTEVLDDYINAEILQREKKLTYDLIAKFTPIYYEFYERLGRFLFLKDRYTSVEEKEDYVRKEYVQVTKERGNVKFFNDNDWDTFRGLAIHQYAVFKGVANMVNNITIKCKQGEANDINLLYGAYVLFDPILKGKIEKEYEVECREFNIWAAEQILNILGIEEPFNKKNKENSNDIIDFSGENFSEENMNNFIMVVEKIVSQAGVEELNEAVDKCYASLKNCRKIYLTMNKEKSIKTYTMKNDFLGKYTVTDKTVQMIGPCYKETYQLVEKIDEFYKNKFESLGSGFGKVNEVIHNIASMLSLLGLGSFDFKNLFDKKENQSVSDIIFLSGFTPIGQLTMWTGRILRIADFLMPHVKKSKTLVRLNEKFWELTKDELKIPQQARFLDQYIIEQHEIKYGMKKAGSACWELYHEVVKGIEDDNQRRGFDSAVYVAEVKLAAMQIPKGEIGCGVFLNLVRAGMMCSEKEIEPEIANSIVDKLYNLYVQKWGIEARVDIAPEKIGKF